MKRTDKNYPMNWIRVCIDEIGEDIRGRIFMPLSEKGIFFSGIRELLLKVDAVFDEAGYPQAFQEKRSFKENRRQKPYQGIPASKTEQSLIAEQCGQKGTYDIIVTSRKNTSWQGVLHNEEEKKTVPFNGEMELLSLLIKK